MPDRRPTLRHRATAILLALSLAAGHALAQSMVSVRNETLNMREGPGTHHAVVWQLARGYPLEVIGRRNDWIQVRDFEGDTGWVMRSLTTSTPHHVIKVDKAHLRAGPGTRHRSKGLMVYGETVRTLRKRDQWVEVQHPKLGRGWVSRSLVWGW
jgi:SH3-like domain-containing protein